MADWQRFNVNEYVRVKLTEEGRAYHRKWYRTRYPMLEYRAPDESDDGWSKWQLWSLMQEFGDGIYMGGPMPFSTTIEFAPPSRPTTNEGESNGAPASAAK
jgi:hypothetical protein